MNPAIQELLRSLKDESLVLDSNLLLLWITARHNLSLLQTFKRVQMFTQNDAVLLAWLIDQFSGVITTPHILTEVSNLANGLSSWARNGWFATFASFAGQTPELFTSASALSGRSEFVRFGIADAALCELSGDYRILTLDSRLSGYLRSSNKQIYDFNELRAMTS